jgi:ubiquinone biosynthesis protein
VVFSSFPAGIALAFPEVMARASTLSFTPPVGRYRQIATILLKHGLGDVVAHLRLQGSLALPRRLLLRRQPAAEAPMSRAQRFRLALEELGPTFVKFGQALSLRTDMLPRALVVELTRLQDDVAPLPSGEAERAVEAAFGRPVNELFAAFDPVPVASASIAQVHRAMLPTGEVVAVKVRRPGIAAVIEDDLSALGHLARLAERHLPEAELYDPSGVVQEFGRTIRRELDLAREGRIIERFARNFAGDPTIRLPRVVWPLTAPGVLTMEYIGGVKVSDLDGVREMGIDPHEVARRGADATLKQILLHGLFHADPHPGNVLVLPGNVICLLDFGIVGRLDAKTRDRILGLVRALAARDAGRLVELVLELLVPLQEVDRTELRTDIEELIDSYADAALEEVDLGEVLHRVVDAMTRHRLRFPADLLLLIKALATIEGVGRQLDPGFRMLRHAAPVAEEYWLQRYSPPALTDRAAGAGRDAAAILRALPRDMAALLRKARGDKLQIQFVHRNLEHFEREMDRSSNRLSFAIVIAALVVGSSLVMDAPGAMVFGVSVVGLAGFVVAGVLGIGLAIGILRSGRL